MTASKWTHAVVLPYLLSGAGCSTMGPMLSQLFSPNKGVPLTEFAAAHGNYFPLFINEFFEGAKRFNEDYRALAEASAQMRLIQVKRLTAADQPVNEANLSWSEDGVYLSYEAVSLSDRKIEVKDLSGRYSRQLLVMPRGKDSFLDGIMHSSIHSYNSGLSWSRDSTRFAFMSNGGVGDYNIYVGAVGVAEQPIARSSAKDGYAAWDPWGEKISFVSSRTGQGDLYLFDLKARALQRLTDDPRTDLFPDWAIDGQSIVYCGGDSMNHDVYALDFNGKKWSKPRPLTRWSQDDLRPKVSPDGKWVAFYASNPDDAPGATRRWNIHVVPLRNPEAYNEYQLRRMAVAKDVVIDINTGPAWTPDSRKIIYVKQDASEMNPIVGYDLYSGRSYRFNTGTVMNRDIMVSRLGVLSFRAQVGAWDRVFVALTNQGLQLQSQTQPALGRLHYQQI